MRKSLLEKAAVSATGHVVSRSVSISGGNNVRVEAVVYGVETSSTLTLAVEQSNDLQNWRPLYTAITVPSVTPGYYPDDTSGGSSVSAAYVRLRASGAACTVSAGLNISTQ